MTDFFLAVTYMVTKAPPKRVAVTVFTIFGAILLWKSPELITALRNL